MKGDVWRCPKCANTLVEADCVYLEVACHRTTACRQGKGKLGATPMVRVNPEYAKELQPAGRSSPHNIGPKGRG